MNAKAHFTGIALLLFFVFLPASNTTAQQTDIQKAEEAILNLRKGVLIVRLPSNYKKMQAMEQLIAEKEARGEDASRLRRQLETTAAESQEFNQNMAKAFRERYQFSEFLFMYDTAASYLQEDPAARVFLDDKLQASPDIQLKDAPFYVLGFGSTSSSSSDGVEAMIIMDENIDRLPKPFPFYQRLHDFQAFIGSIFPKPNQKEEDALRVVEKLNSKLFDYHAEVSAQGGGG